MTHQTAHESLAAYVAGGLDETERTAVEAHVAACADCARELETLRALDRTLRDTLAPPAGFENRLVERLREDIVKPNFKFVLLRRAGIGVAAMLALGATGVAANHIVNHDLLRNASAWPDTLMSAVSPERLLGGERFGPSGKDEHTERGPTILTQTVAKARVKVNSYLPGQDGLKGAYGDGHSDYYKGDVVTAGGGDASLRFKDLRQLEPQGGQGQEADKLKRVLASDPSNVGAKGRLRELEDKQNSRKWAELNSPQAIEKMRKEVLSKDEMVPYSNLLVYPEDWVGLTRLSLKGEGKPGAMEKNGRPEKLPTATPAPMFFAIPANNENSGKKTYPLVKARPEAAPAAPTTQPARSAPTAAQQANRKIIRNGTVEYEVRNFDDAYATVGKLVEEESGFIAATNSDRLANGKMRGVITVRVPPENLDRLVLKLRGLGELKAQQIGSTDISKQYTDLESELRALRAMEERLINIIKTGKGEVKDLVAAEKQLGEYRVKIEKIEGEMRYYNNLVSMATLTITAYEKDIRQAAAATETEAVNMSIETEDVEAKYADARKMIDAAKGRIVESELKRYDADQLNGRIICDVPQDQAEHLTNQLKQLGRVAQLNRDKRVSTDASASTAPAQKIERKDTRLALSLYNLANVAPRETTVMTIAVPDVEAFYRQLLGAFTKEIKQDGKPSMPAGRVVQSNIAGQKPEQRAANVFGDVRASEAQGILEMLRGVSAKGGEVLTASVNVTAESTSSTSAKQGFQVRIVAMASVPPREILNVSAAASNVSDVYNRLLKEVQTLEAAGQARVLKSNLSEPEVRRIVGVLDFHVRRDQREAIDRVLSESGVDVLTRSVERADDPTGRTESKVSYHINLANVESLPPVRTTNITMDTNDVAGTMQAVRETVGTLKGTEVDASVVRSGDEQTARLFADVPLAVAPELLARIRALGAEQTSKVEQAPNVPVGKLARERVNLVLVNAGSTPPVRTTTLELESDDVAGALQRVRDAIAAVKGKEIGASLDRSPDRQSGSIVVDVPVDSAADLLGRIKAVGSERASKVQQNQSAVSKLARERIAVTFASKGALVPQDRTFGAILRDSLGTALKFFAASLYLILSAALFVGPWVLVGWLIWRIFRRRTVKA